MFAVQVSIEMLSSDYVAELRAEVTVWWESLRAKPPTQSDGPIRIITQGQELITEFDEKTLGEIGFKDSQVSGSALFVTSWQRQVDPSVSSSRAKSSPSSLTKICEWARATFVLIGTR